jgi:probable F420-dependent oxidoreductase
MELQDHFRALGVWFFTDGMSLAQAEELVGRIEQLGYSALWLPDTAGRDPFAHIAHLAGGTTSLVFATGIASIFHRHPGPMQQVANTLAEQTDGRFVLGLGVSHAPMVVGLRKLDYSKPLSQMREYLAAMDASPYSASPPAQPPIRLLAALGPKMIELSRDAADGAHPYWTTPEHTAQARAILGPDKLLCVEQKVVLSTDPSVARELAAQAVGTYADLPNYRNNWKRLGFTDDEIERREPRFIDAVVAWGDADAIRARLQAHYDAGATHVCIQPLSADRGQVDWACLEELAPAS